MLKEYGVPDEDKAAYDLLLQLVGDQPLRHILHHPRKPLDARSCQLPGSLLVQAVLLDGTVLSVRQTHKGKVPRKV